MRTHLLFISALLILLTITGCSTEFIYIVYDQNSAVQKEIAGELSKYLSETYEKSGFELVPQEIDGKKNIVLTIEQLPDSEKEAFRIEGETNRLVIGGNSDLALIHGVYALLREIGWNFYLSFEVPPRNPEPLDFEAFKLEDAPLKDTRIVFNWHNFLSGCTGWDLEDWQQWIDQSRKIGFNTIMVHAYGNNPIQPMEMNGIKKEVGYLTTTKKGRDWGAQHVNDVRQMIGGRLFEQSEFGSKAAMVDQDKRSEAAVKLMQQVFTHAEEKSMNLCYAIDVDTWMANPQNILRSLPAESWIEIDTFKVANPDTPGGKRYYQEQLSQLFNDYPQITHLAAWMRRPPNEPTHGMGTIWLKIKYEDMPASWKKEFDALAKQHPEITRKMPYPAYFAMSRIISCYREILDEIKPSTELLLGSWQLFYPPVADLFMPAYCGFIPLDYSYVLDQPGKIEDLARAGKDRKLYPVVWAHHDDGRYIGRPYMPFENFNSLLDATNAEGYGVIHWTTHPLDLLFENYERQVWASSENQPLRDAVEAFCASFLKTEEKNLLDYYQLWFSEGPMLGRETLDHFIATNEPYELDGYLSALDAKEKAEKRLQLLMSTNQSALNPHGKKEYLYQVEMEKFIISFFNNHHHIHQGFLALEEGDYELAGKHALQTNPEEAIGIYADAIKAYGATRGEMGVLVSLNLRWMPDYIDLRQRTGLDDIRINFQPTSHDPLAQQAGHFSFHIDPEGGMWIGLGEKEIGQDVKAGSRESARNVTENWISITNSTEIAVTTMRKHPLKPGKYTVEILKATQTPGGSFIVDLLEDGEIVKTKDFAESDLLPTFDFSATDKTFSIRITPAGKPLKLSAIRLSAS